MAGCHGHFSFQARPPATIPLSVSPASLYRNQGLSFFVQLSRWLLCRASAAKSAAQDAS